MRKNSDLFFSLPEPKPCPQESDDSDEEEEERKEKKEGEEKKERKETKERKKKNKEGGEEERKDDGGREEGGRLHMIRKKTTSFGRSFSTLPIHQRGGSGVAPALTKMCVGEYVPLLAEEDGRPIRFDPPGGWQPLKTRFVMNGGTFENFVIHTVLTSFSTLFLPPVSLKRKQKKQTKNWKKNIFWRDYLPF